MGLFALGVICAVFAFVYWLDAAGGLSRRSSYVIRFDGSVSGLLRGSAVLFNGVRVGEVGRLDLIPSEPESVMVEIAVDNSAPVRQDTKVGIDFQGLTGAPVIALSGGSAKLPILSDVNGEKPILTAEKGAGQGMSQVARQVLQRLDTVISENSEPLRNTIASINTFSAALARNSEKVDGIFDGLSRLTGGGKKPTQIIDLSPAKFNPIPSRVPDGPLLIPEPTALALLDSERIYASGTGAGALDLSDMRWPDILSKVLQTRIIQSFENTGYKGAVGRTLDELKTAHRLLIDVRAFGIQTGPDPAATVELSVKVADNAGHIISSRIFRVSRPLTELRSETAMKALNESAGTAFSELVLWVCATV
jgi:phospholipid/cholesterol/gamma-HCH transport system substrate-binding protein